MKYIKLLDFLDFLNARTKADFSGDCVDRFLAAHRVEQDQFLPFIFFREDTYGRNLIWKTPHFELLVLTWLPGQRSPIHDHNGQRAWALVDSGALTFQRYERPNGPAALCLPKGDPETARAGHLVYSDDTLGPLAIANETKKPAVSVHLYAGPVPHCRTYDAGTQRFELADLEYFTKLDEEWGKSVLERH